MHQNNYINPGLHKNAWNSYQNPGLQKWIDTITKILAYKMHRNDYKFLCRTINVVQWFRFLLGAVIKWRHVTYIVSYNIPNKKSSCAITRSSYSRICCFKRLIVFFNVEISFLWETKNRRYIFKRQFKVSNRPFQSETKIKKCFL